MPANETAAAAALAGVAREPGVAKPDAILVANNVKRHFGGLVAVDVEHAERFLLVRNGVAFALLAGQVAIGLPVLLDHGEGQARPRSCE